jgi:glycosyltransferase involved in cell wall biosynthesis
VKENNQNQQVKVLAIIPGLINVFYIEIINPFLNLQKQGKISFYLSFTGSVKLSEIEDCDLVVFSRATDANEAAVLDCVMKSKKPFLYLVDDNFFEISLETNVGKYHRNAARLHFHKRFIQNASLVRAMSPAMESQLSLFNKNVVLRNCYFEFESIKGLIKKTDKKIKIVYATSRSGYDFLQYVFLNALKKILKLYPNNVEAYFWGPLPKDPDLLHLTNLKHLPFVSNYHSYLKLFYEFGFDIGLAPLKNDIFHNSKTNNKYREYGACGIAGIYSEGELYGKYIRNNVNGILVKNNSDDWFNAIQSLVQDKALRDNIKLNAQTDIRQNYKEEIYLEKLYEDLNWVINNGSKLQYPDIVKINSVDLILDKSSLENSNDFIKNLTDFLRELGVGIQIVYDLSKLRKENSKFWFIFTDSIDFMWDFLAIEDQAVHIVLFTNNELITEVESIKYNNRVLSFMLRLSNQNLSCRRFELNKLATVTDPYTTNSFIYILDQIELSFNVLFYPDNKKRPILKKIFIYLILILKPWLKIAKFLIKPLYMILRYLKDFLFKLFFAFWESYIQIKNILVLVRQKMILNRTIVSINQKRKNK